MRQPSTVQEFLLLCYEPTTGRPLVDGTRMSCGLAGAMVAELALAGLVAIDDDRVTAAGRAATGDAELDALLERIAAQSRPRKAKWWVNKTQSGGLRDRVRRAAVGAGLLRHEQRRVLGIFTMNDYYPSDPRQREALRRRIADALHGPGATDGRAVALLALCGAVGLDAKLFPGLSARERKRMMKRATENDAIGRAVSVVIQSIQAATAGVVAASGGGGGDGGGGGS